MNATQSTQANPFAGAEIVETPTAEIVETVRWCKLLDGSWGVRGPERLVRDGAKVSVANKAGEVKVVTIDETAPDPAWPKPWDREPMVIGTIRKGAAGAGAGAKADPPEGFHEVDGRVYKVQVAHHGSGNLYAKILNVEEGGWEYNGRKSFNKLSDATLLTLERAQELGRLYGVCCRCGATLTDETSIEAGIGPICATRF